MNALGIPKEEKKVPNVAGQCKHCGKCRKSTFGDKRK
jgi:hypothetical protein